jgi:phospholipid-translocating ATPase
VFFSSLPVLAAGILEQDVSDATSLAIPQLYMAGPRNVFFTNKLFFKSLLMGALHSCSIYFIVTLSLRLGYQVCLPLLPLVVFKFQSK